MNTSSVRSKLTTTTRYSPSHWTRAEISMLYSLARYPGCPCRCHSFSLPMTLPSCRVHTLPSRPTSRSHSTSTTSPTPHKPPDEHSRPKKTRQQDIRAVHPDLCACRWIACFSTSADEADLPGGKGGKSGRELSGTPPSGSTTVVGLPPRILVVYHNATPAEAGRRRLSGLTDIADKLGDGTYAPMWMCTKGRQPGRARQAWTRVNICIAFSLPESYASQDIDWRARRHCFCSQGGDEAYTTVR